MRQMILAWKRVRLTRRSCTRGLKTRTHQHRKGVDVLHALAGGIGALRISNASASAGGGARLVTNPTCLRACKEFAPAPPGEQVLHAGAILVADRTRRSDTVQSQALRRGERQARRCRPALMNIRPRAIAFLCTSRAAFCCARPG